MTIFELVKIALDELYQEATKRYGAAVDDQIRTQMSYLSNNYRKLNNSDREPIDYKDPATRFAYVYKYVAAHGDYLVQALCKLRDRLEGPIFSSSAIRVSCLGGGPGSDIIAVLKYLDENAAVERPKKAHFYLLDREQAWADTWTELDSSLDLKFAFNTNFQQLDVTNPESWEYQTKFLQADLFTLSFFVSEVMSLDAGGVVTDFWKTVLKEAKSGSFIVYHDNGHKDFNDYFDKMWDAQNFDCLVSRDNSKIIPRFSEQSSVLNFYKEKFSQNAKIESFSSMRVLRKK